MRKLIAVVLGVTTVAAASAGAANAQYYDRYHRYHRASYRRSCGHDRRVSGNRGALGGAVVGGASGALIGHDALGALVGAGVGAVAGHEIAKNRVRC